MPKRFTMKLTSMIIFTNPDHQCSDFNQIRQQSCLKSEKKPYAAFELKPFDTFWCQKTGDAGARHEYYYKLSKGSFIVINGKEYAPYNIKRFSTREDVEKYYNSLEDREKNRCYTYYPYDNIRFQKGYSKII